MTGPLVLLHVQQRGQPDHLPLVVPHLKLPDVAGVAAEPLIGLDVHLPGPAELVEVVDVVRAQVDLERVEELADRHAQGHALGPVDLEVQPGRVRPGAVEQALEARRLVAPLDDLVADPLQVVQAEIAAILDDELEAAGRAQAVDRRRSERRDDRPAHLALTALRELRGDRVGRQLGAAPVRKLLEHDVHRAEVRRVGVQEQRLARDADRVLDPRRLAGQRFDAGHDPLRPLHRGRVGQLHVEEQIPLVLLRDEARGRAVELPVGQHQQAAVEHEHDRADPQHAADDPAVDRGHPVEEPVEAPEEPAQHGVHRPDDEPADQLRRPPRRGRNRRRRSPTTSSPRLRSLAVCARSGRQAKPPGQVDLARTSRRASLPPRRRSTRATPPA